MGEINITNKKTWFIPKFSSSPSDGTVTYTCPEFFNVSGGSLSYSGDTISGDTEIYARENEGAEDRSGSFSLTATTNPSSAYSGTTEIACAWTVTQAGVPVIPTLELSTPASAISSASTAITYTIESNVKTTVKYKDVTEQHEATTGATGQFVVPVNTGDSQIVHVISAWCTDNPSVSATTTVTQAQASSVTQDIRVSVYGKVSDYTGGSCTRLNVYWSGLTIGTQIRLFTNDAAIMELIQIYVSAATGSYTKDNMPTVRRNDDSRPRRVEVTAKLLEDTGVTGSDSWMQDGKPETHAAVWIDPASQHVTFKNYGPLNVSATSGFFVNIGWVNKLSIDKDSIGALTAIGAGSAKTLTATADTTSGESTFEIRLSWEDTGDGNIKYDRRTTYYWKENGIQQSKTLSGNTEVLIRTATGDTKLSDFEVRTSQLPIPDPNSGV